MAPVADYQVRCWDAGHQHMALVMPGTLLLVKQINGGQQWPLLSFNDLVTGLAHWLPWRQLTVEKWVDIIGKRHVLRGKAKDSNRTVSDCIQMNLTLKN